MPLEKQTIPSDLLRQREHTVDDVKRLYAFVLSLSFTNFLREIFDTASDYLPKAASAQPALLQPALLQPAQLDPAFARTMYLDFALLGIFLFTAAIYYFHCDKFLDIRYAMPLPNEPSPGKNQVVVVRWQSGQFGWDCLTLIMTVIPFAIMSFTLDKTLVARFGIIPFYAAYVVLLQFSVGLIMVGAVWRRLGRIWRCLLGSPPGDTDDRPTILEERRYSALNMHWSVVDTAAVLILQQIFWFAKKDGGLCGPLGTDAAIWFVWLFLAVAFLRNVVDYFSVWPFLFLSGDGTGTIGCRLIIKLFINSDLEVKGGRATRLLVGLLYLYSLWVVCRQLYGPMFDNLNRCLYP
jgi:hypothetical protein